MNTETQIFDSRLRLACSSTRRTIDIKGNENDSQIKQIINSRKVVEPSFMHIV